VVRVRQRRERCHQAQIGTDFKKSGTWNAFHRRHLRYAKDAYIFGDGARGNADGTPATFPAQALGATISITRLGLASPKRDRKSLIFGGYEFLKYAPPSDVADRLEVEDKHMVRTRRRVDPPKRPTGSGKSKDVQVMWFRRRYALTPMSISRGYYHYNQNDFLRCDCDLKLLDPHRAYTMRRNDQYCRRID